MELHSNPCHKNRATHEERRLQIDELDAWQTHIEEKPKVHDESKQRHDERRDETKQFKFGDKVLLNEKDPRIAISGYNTNAAIPITILNIFLHGTVEFFTIIKPTYSELALEFCTTFHLHHVMNTHDEPGTIIFRLGGLTDLTTSIVPYDASRSKATPLPPILRYIHAILTHTLTERRESIGVVSTIDAYFLWSMATGHYRLVQFDDQDELEDIIDDVTPPHEEPPPPPPLSHRPPAATLIDLSEPFTRFE
ncbi:hypothetical protein GOBAR_AA15036 [Gossypium barbadense]|uniref:Uncharacterized protein n=1 Tax=Gossypium barbadense TaxID=3634 RepID=A0A2P5XQK2_GOSBA|nr:hypothetical protein GOBAR_AA15036 [Gossypium barbadense]